MKKMKNRIQIAGLFCALCFTTVRAEETWRFINIADWHGSEGYVGAQKFPDKYQEMIQKDAADVKAVKELFGGDLMILPGDSNTGRWDRPDFVKNFMPGAAPEETILKAGNLCYSTMIRIFSAGGYPRLLMAVGDHELGDNPWPAGSTVARCQPQYRQAFSSAWNCDPVSGEFIYAKNIGKAPSRPLGTPYEKTSYAYRHKNTLFVTLDVFEQDSPAKVIGGEGTVTGQITGKHLDWLDQVLSEARKDLSIRYIFVQGHLPVLHPVRKVSSSGMLMDNCEESEFWKVLRKYNVDVYFAGEVHANTVTKDPQSDLLQVVSRGNLFSNVMTVDVSSNRLELTSYNQTGTEPSDGKYEARGKLVISKSESSKKITGEGTLSLLDPGARLLYFPLDQTISLKDHPIQGLAEFKKADTLIRNQLGTQEFVNEGAFGQQYNALGSGVELVDGIRGKAALLNEDSRLTVWAMGPVDGGHAVSYSVWLKTEKTGNRLVINTASIWHKGGGFFNLNLNEGAPEIMVSGKDSLTAQDVKLNDGQWHQVAAVMPQDNCMLSEVKIYADGKPLQTVLHGQNRRIVADQAVKMGFGGLNYSKKEFDTLPVQPFVGALDEISVWTRSLRPEEISALAK